MPLQPTPSSLRRLRIAALLAGVLLCGCGEDTPTDPGDGGGGGGTLPFDIFEISLQPNAIEQPVTGAPTPSPLVAQYALTAFPRGGASSGVFDWTVPTSVGTVVPKTAQLTVRDITVGLRPRVSGPLPLGFFTVRVRGERGAERDSLSARFAVVQNRWMKHKRQVSPMFVADLVRSPTVYSPPGTAPENDLIYYCEAPSGPTTTLRWIRAHADLNGPEQEPNDVILLPSLPEQNNFNTAAKTEPDVAPHGSGRSELLFSSTMDLLYGERCENGTCPGGLPNNLWIVRRGLVPFEPRPLTFDSTRAGPGGGTIFYAFNYTTPRWDPTATGSVARIAFLSTLSGTQNLWLADLLDRDGDLTSDTLVNYRRLTNNGVARYDWHPDGTRLCVVSGGGFGWVNASTGAFTPITLPDAGVMRIDAVSVYAPAGQPTLVAFQGARENQSTIYVYNESEGTLTRVLPVAGGIDQPLQPRWHPRRKEIVYVGDYTVEAWSNSSGALSIPDQLNPLTPVVNGQRRTRYPSVWALRLENP